MKKNVLSILLIIVFTVCCLVPIAQGSTAKSERKADEILSSPSAPKMANEILSSPSTPTHVVPPVAINNSNEAKILKQLRADSKNFRTEARQWAEKGIAAEKGRTEALQTIAAVSKDSEENKKQFTKTVDDFKSTLDTFEKNVTTRTLILGGIGIVGVVLIVIALWIFYSKIAKCMDNKALTILKGVQGEAKDIREKTAEATAGKVAEIVKNIPKETADEIEKREFNPKPFEFDIVGKHVVYAFPTDDKCYRTLQVEDDNGGIDPANFERQVLANRPIAKKYSKGMLIKFLEGKLAGTKEEALINYLWDTKKEITISLI